MSEIAYPKYRYFVVITLCIAQAVVTMILAAPATIIGEMSKTMGLSMGETTALVMVAVNVFVALSAFLGGTLVDKLGAYRVWAACSCLLLIGALLVPLIGNSFLGMLFIRFLQGFGAGPIMATPPLVVAQWSPPQERGIIIGIQGAVVSGGAAISLTFVPFVFQKTGSWQAAMAWVSVFCFLALVLSLIVPLGPKPPVVRKADACPGHTEIEVCSDGTKKAMLLPATWAAALCCFFFSWSGRVFYDMIPNYLAVDPPVGVGLGPLKAGEIMSGLNVIFAVASILSGIILEKVFKGRVKGLVMIGFMMPSLLWFFIKYPVVFSDTLILSSFIWAGGFGFALTFPLVMTFISKTYPKGIMGKLGGLITGFNTIGTLVGLGAGSYALHVTGRYHIPIDLASAGAFLGFLSAILLNEPTAFSKVKTNQS